MIAKPPTATCNSDGLMTTCKTRGDTLKSRKEKMMDELRDIFSRTPDLTFSGKKRLAGELQIAYCVSHKTAIETIDAFVATGRANEIPCLNRYKCLMCEAGINRASDKEQPIVCPECKRKALKLVAQEDLLAPKSEYVENERDYDVFKAEVK